MNIFSRLPFASTTTNKNSTFANTLKFIFTLKSSKIKILVQWRTKIRADDGSITQKSESAYGVSVNPS